MDEALREKLLRIYEETKTIAVVGASDDPSKAAHRIPRYLKEKGYRIMPVNPKGGEILGERAYTSLAEITDPIDVVDVFRPSEEAPAIAREAIEAKAKVLWLQQGISSEKARELAEGAGMTAVVDMCMGATHRKLALGPGPEERQGVPPGS